MHNGALKQFVGIGMGIGGSLEGTLTYSGPVYGLAWHVLYFQAGYYFYNDHSANTIGNTRNLHGLLGLRFEL
jgi:hypothetical protein